jgi:NAD(P)-dependent dehydrogenase (short-subunit alcohol dehydrogenase family)
VSESSDPANLFRLDGEVVLLTGATGGLGRQFVAALDGAGARLVLSGRQRHALEELASQCRDAVAIPADLSDSAAVDALATQALEHYGTVDVLVNNAGTGGSAPGFDEPMEDVRSLFEINLVSSFRLSQFIGRSMKDRGANGSIINIASLVGVVGVGRVPLGGYTASKGAVIGLTRELAAQWGRYGIRVNALTPGWFGVGMAAWVNDDPKTIEWITRQTPLRRLGQPNELDGALLFLATRASSFMTGQTLVIDGGWTSI